MNKGIKEQNRAYTLFSWANQGQIDPPVMTKAQGVWFWDGDGERWLDFSSQLINMNLGHQHPKVIQAIKDQAEALCFAGPGFATQPKGELGQKLAEITGMAKAFFTLGGSEANENAIKIAKLYTGRSKIITRYRSYHGATMGSLSASGDPRRWPVEPGIPGIVRVFDPYCYRCPFGQSPDSCARECVSHIEEVINLEGPDSIAAILVEGITGSNGLLVPPDDYYPRLRELCNRYQILLISDEVMSGFGRTGTWTALEHYGVKPDLITCAKGLTSGYVPLGAVLVSEPVAQFFEDHTFYGGLTYSGHPLACATALANLAAYQEEEVFANVARQGEYLASRLEAMRSYACVGDVRYKGLFTAIELVADQTSRAPLAPGSPAGQALWRHLAQKKLYTFPRPNLLMICPPLVINREELDYGLAIVEEALALASRELSSVPPAVRPP